MINLEKDKIDLLDVLDEINIDYKASIVSAELVSKGLNIDNIFFKNISNFKRFISKDIENYEVENFDNDDKHLVFELNRESIYDMLPESLFHFYDKTNKSESISEEFIRHRVEEKAARLFFSPIENEIEKRILYFELIERELSLNTSIENNRKFFEYFFGNSSILDDKQVLMLLYILPLSYKIKSNINLIEIILSKILRFEIKVDKYFKSEKINYNSNESNKNILGVSLICSEYINLYSWHYTININNVPKDKFETFYNNGTNKNILDFIIPFIFPVTSNVTLITNSLINERKILFSDEEISFLGFNSYICI